LYYDYYETFRMIRSIRIGPKQIYVDYGQKAAFNMNNSCPIVVEEGGRPLDCLADELGFDSADELYEAIMNYKPEQDELSEINDYYEDQERPSGYV